MCRGDRHLIAQALLNLMTAAQAMERQEGERRIEIGSSWSSVSSRDGFVTVSVADSGPGVPEEVREKIFDPFFTTKQGGDRDWAGHHPEDRRRPQGVHQSRDKPLRRGSLHDRAAGGG